MMIEGLPFGEPFFVALGDGAPSFRSPAGRELIDW